MNTFITPSLLVSALVLTSGISHAQMSLEKTENKIPEGLYRLQSHTAKKIETIITDNSMIGYQDADNRRMREIEKMEQDANAKYGGDTLTFQGDSNGIMRPAIRIGRTSPLGESSLGVRLSSKQGGRVTLVYKLRF